ncbi:hypothetical protein IQ226_04620 [Dolichospermum sp. LEGE 00240]|jgi:hypothetical protein|uniref:hypothetical protein n=1 Tax=Dolichospermum sp. LEGE 00240 TaxID=1828603 RepID=UPI001881334A|nr:hypothetical protein [Dolichospermum sp. LEGE 00240]MBE9248485.1 hypothetical protein [Dolichospermum sp. LEGE 00240]MDM3844459.1 hypothetical protein [Aphanizomenon gracile PMC638.10]MDM3851967.1 hypothetical protein [Aphanizomenon gracile PMC627.10]MDM3857272.1 hypothetical protein [Aphanizomenon gracile PMC649.10]
MKAEYDFSQAEQGKFYNADATFHYPIYLEPDVDNFLKKIAQKKNIDVQTLVNEWLRNNIKLIESIQ